MKDENTGPSIEERLSLLESIVFQLKVMFGAVSLCFKTLEDGKYYVGNDDKSDNDPENKVGC